MPGPERRRSRTGAAAARRRTTDVTRLTTGRRITTRAIAERPEDEHEDDERRRNPEVEFPALQVVVEDPVQVAVDAALSGDRDIERLGIGGLDDPDQRVRPLLAVSHEPYRNQRRLSVLGDEGRVPALVEAPCVVDDSARSDVVENRRDLVAKARVVDVQARGADQDELVDVFALRGRREVPSDELVPLLGLGIRRDLAFRGQLHERDDRRDRDDEHDDPAATRQPWPARARARDALGGEPRRRVLSPTRRRPVNRRECRRPAERAFGCRAVDRGVRTSHDSAFS